MKKNHLFTSALTLFAVLAVTGCAPATPAKTVGTAVDGNEQKIETAAMQLAKDVKAGAYELLSTQDLKTKIDQKEDMILIDTMPAESYKKGHIPGALNAELPKEGIDTMTPEQKQAFLAVLGSDTSKPVVLYCGFVGCARSHVGALVAQEAGFSTVYRHPGGIVAWKDAGYEVQSEK